MYFVWYLLLGLASGWIANLIVKGDGSGLIINLIVGLVGGVLGGWLFSPCAARFARQSGDFGHRRRRAVVDRRRHNAQENPINLNHSIMDTLKTDKTDTAEAENIETMELLTGMLDNATQCGCADDENPEPEKSGK